MRIDSTEAVNIIRDQARLNLAEGFPSQLNPSVVPVIDMTPRFHKTCNVVENRTASGTIFTTATDVDTYITGATLSGAKAAASTGATLLISVVQDGITKSIVNIAGITLTAERDSIAHTFYPPIKVDRGSAVVCTAGGVWDAIRCTVQGFTV